MLAGSVKTFDQRLCNTWLQSQYVPLQPATSSERSALIARYPVRTSAVTQRIRSVQVKRRDGSTRPPTAPGNSSDRGQGALIVSKLVAAISSPRRGRESHFPAISASTKNKPPVPFIRRERRSLPVEV